jgi:hypothetical protein
LPGFYPIPSHLEKLNKDNYPERNYLVMDNPSSFRSSGERYLDRKIHNVNTEDMGLLERHDLKEGSI